MAFTSRPQTRTAEQNFAQPNFARAGSGTGATHPRRNPGGLQSRTWQHAVARHRRFLAAGLVAAAVAAALQVLAPGAAPTVAVVVAATDLRAGVRLTAADLSVREVSPDHVPESSSADPGAWVGRVLTAPMLAEEVLTDTRVVAPGLVTHLGSEQVATPVRLADAAGAALLRPGDQISLLAPVIDQSQTASTAILAEDVLVLAVVETEGNTIDTAAGGLIVVAATMHQAQAITLAAANSPISAVISTR